jgi:hypothetical protein
VYFLSCSRCLPSCKSMKVNDMIDLLNGFIFGIRISGNLICI